MRCVALLFSIVALSVPASAQLFAGIETGSGQSLQVSDLSGFPAVSWNASHVIDVSGAAARPDGTVYVCNGAFTTRLFEIQTGGAPSLLSTIDKDMQSLAYGRDKLFGFSNYASPKGIYEIDPGTGVTTLLLDTYSGPGYRFFALDYNPVDDMLYGYTEFGASGLYSIHIDSGVMTFLTGTIPASNGQGRGLAVGNNTVYLTGTRGDDGIGYFAYELSQGAGGSWVEFNNPYPNDHATGGAAWVALPAPGAAYCFGDGTGSPCPCGLIGNPGEGCMNSTVTNGATLNASGNASISSDSFALAVAGVPGSKPGLVLRGSNQVAGGFGNPAGDGLLCTAGQSARSQVQMTSAGGSTFFTDFQGAPFGASSYGAGQTTNYQFWYRDPSAACTGAGFNFTNGWTVTWVL